MTDAAFNVPCLIRRTTMMILGDEWENARKRKLPTEPATETLDALQKRLCGEHCSARHGGEGVRWGLDLAGVYCEDCLDEGYHFNLLPCGDFVRVFDGFEPEIDFREYSFLPA